MAVRRYVEQEEIFLANYSDGLTDLPFSEYLDQCLRQNRVASFLSVRPSQSFHTVSYDDAGNVLAINPVKESHMWVNGGFFVLKRNIFGYMEEGDELVEAPFQRLIAEKQLYTYKYMGFWAAMDTFKDKTTFDSLYAQRDIPWATSKK